MSRFYIKRNDLATHGYTQRCKGCSVRRLERPPQGHGRVPRARTLDLHRIETRDDAEMGNPLRPQSRLIVRGVPSHQAGQEAVAPQTRRERMSR